MVKRDFKLQIYSTMSELITVSEFYCTPKGDQEKCHRLKTVLYPTWTFNLYLSYTTVVFN